MLPILLKLSPFKTWMKQYCCPVDWSDVALVVILVKLLPCTPDVDTEVMLQSEVVR
jgi:hypothetical protein